MNDPTRDTIAGDRRRHRRYAICLNLKYKITRGKRLVDTGSGQTRNMSTGGVAFTTDQPLPVGTAAELWVEWPYSLNGFPMRLVITGRIVRATRTEAAIRTAKHEFRLAGTSQLTNMARQAFATFEAREWQ